MSTSPEQVQALADAVSMWRSQEYISISFYCLYVYYVLTTLAEDVSVIFPQRWSRGKTLYMIIRYGFVAYIALSLSRDFRSYFIISPEGCKILTIILQVIFYVNMLACDFSLGLCLSALLQAKILGSIAIITLSCALPFVYAIMSLVGGIQYPAEPVTSLDEELGYACFYVSTDQWADETVTYVGRNIRSYVNLATTILLALVGVVTLFVRYRGQSGGVVQIIRRDGGLHYLSLLALRLVSTILSTPTLLSVSELDASPAYQLWHMANEVVIPILAQRLLINMRKVDYMGSQPVASILLFASQGHASESDLEGETGSFEMSAAPSSSRGKEVENTTITEKSGVGEGSSSA